ncbi:methyltransferase [uncultured Alsobacter sp.]|uniref:methyltransferase n=1 Tax=uncultured Alsobacter sp. TaxID=1748258 RepID=UPI0025D2FA06|nr:methyltransferase [uncultured Alsobacter sp.]
MTDVRPALRDHEPRRLVDWWYAVRDPLLRSERFQRWAAAFPLTRPLARRRAGELFDLVSGFVYSQILHAVVRLRLLDLVADEPMRVEAIAPAIGLDVAATRRLCSAAAAVRLLSERGEGRFGLGDLGAALLGNPGVGAMVEHHALLYEDLRDPVALLRGEVRDTALSRFWAYASAEDPGALTPAQVAAYSRLMGVSQQFIADEVLDAYSFAKHRRLLDVGGGEGAFVRTAARRHSHLSCAVFDLPAVAERARETFAAAGLTGRAEAFGGDLFRDTLPQGADLVTLVRVLYDHPRDNALAILKAVRAVVPQDGVLLVAEPMAATPGAETVGAAYFGFYLMAMKGGDARSVDEISGLLREAGFERVSPVRTRSPLFTSLIEARP